MEDGISDIHFALSDSIVSGLNRGGREDFEIRKFRYAEDGDVFNDDDEISLDKENNNVGSTEDLEIHKYRQRKNSKSKKSNINVNNIENSNNNNKNNNNNNNNYENHSNGNKLNYDNPIASMYNVGSKEDLEIRKYRYRKNSHRSKTNDNNIVNVNDDGRFKRKNSSRKNSCNNVNNIDNKNSDNTNLNSVNNSGVNLNDNNNNKNNNGNNDTNNNSNNSNKRSFRRKRLRHSKSLTTTVDTNRIANRRRLLRRMSQSFIPSCVSFFDFQ